MVRLTRINCQPLVINASVIAFVEATPDTLVTLTNGDRVHVRETVDEVIAGVAEFHRRVLACPPATAHTEER
jgi:flagellar protein FlbD